MKALRLILLIFITFPSLAMNWWTEPKEARTKARQERVQKEFADMKKEKEQEGFDDYTLLLNAAKSGDIDRVEFLLNQGVNPNKNRSYEEAASRYYRAENTPLIVSAIRNALDGDDRILYMLINAGADINAQGFNGNTALQTLVAAEQFDYYPHIVHTITLLLNVGANPDIYDNNGQSPLISAIVHRRYNIIQLLLSHGANPNIFTLKTNSSALMVAVKRLPYHIQNYDEYLKIIHLLLQAGADPFLKTNRPYFSTDKLDSAFTLAQKELESEDEPKRKAALQSIIDMFNDPTKVKKTGFQKIP